MYSPQEKTSDLGTGPVRAQPLSEALWRSLGTAELTERLGWVVAILVCAGYLLYIAQLTSFPLQDYPNHVARGTALADLLFHHGQRFGQFFEFHVALVPYLLHDLMLAGCLELFGTSGGAAVFSGLVLLSLPCALLFYMHVTQVAPRARLLVFLVSLYLSTDFFFLMAFMAFRLGLAMILVNLALVELLRRKWSATLFAGYLAVLVVGYLVHLTSLVFFAPVLLITALVRLGFGVTTLRREAWLLLPVLALLGVHFGFVVEPRNAANPPVYAFNWGTPRQKLIDLQMELERFDGRPSKPLMIMFAFCLLWPVRHSWLRERLTQPAVLEKLLVAALFLAAFVILPEEYSDSSFVDVRAEPMMTLFLLLACLHLPQETSGGREFNTLPVLGVAGLLSVCNLGYLGIHLGPNDAWLAHYRQAASYIPKGSRVLPVTTRGKQTFLAPLLHAGSLVLIDRGALVPYLFSGDRGDPMKYFRYRHRPYVPDEGWYLSQKNWRKATARTFEVDGQWYRWRFDRDPGDWFWYMVDVAPVDWNRIACDYDYLLIGRPYQADFVRVPTRTVVANESAALLAIDKGACHPGTPQRPSPVRLPSER